MRILIWALAGLVLGAGLMVLAAGVIVPALWDVSQAEGAYAMQVMFFFAPVGAILGGLLGGLLGWARS